MSFTGDDWKDRPIQTATRSLISGWMLAFLGVLLVLVIVAAVWVLGVFSSGAVGRGDQIKQVNSAYNRTAWYQEFYTLEQDFKSQVTNVQLARQALATFEAQNPPAVRAADQTGNLESTYTQDQTNLTGAQQVCVSTANKYNIESQERVIGAQFKASGLPATLDQKECD